MEKAFLKLTGEDEVDSLRGSLGLKGCVLGLIRIYILSPCVGYPTVGLILLLSLRQNVLDNIVHGMTLLHVILNYDTATTDRILRLREIFVKLKN